MFALVMNLETCTSSETSILKSVHTLVKKIINN